MSKCARQLLKCAVFAKIRIVSQTILQKQKIFAKMENLANEKFLQNIQDSAKFHI
jgi:hypothetical protein